MKQQSQPQEPRNSHLEPRVAKLEVGMERLTDDVRSLAAVVREQGSQMEQEIQKLVVAVTQAAGPRKTDWSTIFAGLMLVMAIGSAVFWPLSQTSEDNKKAVQTLSDQIDEHNKLQLHPVGHALVNRLELQLQDHVNNNMQTHKLLEDANKDRMELVVKTVNAEVKGLEEKINLHNDRLYARVVKIEEKHAQDVENELAELRLWRLRAMNGEIKRIQSLPENGESPHPSPASAHNPPIEAVGNK